MKHILCFGDSNTYGYSPDDGQRYGIGERWTSVLQQMLGSDYRIIEEGLGGRTTVFDDPTSPGRRGSDYLLPCLQSHQPLDLVIIMLGTNDCKGFFGNSAYDIAKGMALLGKTVLNPQNWDVGSCPELLLVSPAPLGEKLGTHPIFGEHLGPEALECSKRLAARYRETASELGCRFFDAGSCCAVSPEECVHLDLDAHRALAAALAREIKEIFS